MTRKKVKLAFIVNDSARKTTYKKRKRGLLKKMEELTTLCDVKACAILYSSYEPKPVVWPNPSGARDVISSFRRLPEMEKAKKMVNQEEFLRQRVVKVREQLHRQQRENREKEMTQVMYECLTGRSFQNMSLLDLNDLNYVIGQSLGEIKKRIEILKNQNPNLNNNSLVHFVNNNVSNNVNAMSVSNNIANPHSMPCLPSLPSSMGLGAGREGLPNIANSQSISGLLALPPSVTQGVGCDGLAISNIIANTHPMSGFPALPPAVSQGIRGEGLPISNNIANTNFMSGLQQLPGAIGQGVGGEGLQGESGDSDAMEVQRMMQTPWSSFMEMLRPQMGVDQQHQMIFHQQGLGNNGVYNVAPNTNVNASTSASTSNNNNNNNNNMSMNMMRMRMGQLNDYQGNNGANRASSSNNVFLP